MSRSTRIITLTGLLITLVTGVSFARPSWPTDLGVDFWSMPALKEKLQRESRWRDELESLDQTVMWRIAVKDRIVADLLAHRTSLLRAAAFFRLLNEDEPRYMAVLRDTYPSRSDEECLCRNVIAYATNTRQRPERVRAEVARLEAELRAAMGADGRIQLPE